MLCHSVPNARICHIDGLPVVFLSHQLLPLCKWDDLVRFAGWAFMAIMRAVFDLLRGHWWHAILLTESGKAAIVRFQTDDKLARDYLFHQSGSIYRPLWTYEAEKKGARIIFYFYSTNCGNFKRPEGYLVDMGSWHVMNWPLYLVWDEFHADFVRRAVGKDARIEVVKPIYFISCTVEMPALPPRSMAVFDVQPQRSSRYQILGAAEEYYVPRTSIAFLSDIHTVILENKGTMAHKRKRHIGNRLHPKYAAFIKSIIAIGGVLSIEPDTSALRVIEGCSAVISMPFTSTALWGRELGKPSVYYDPFGAVQKDDRAAHGIQVLCGKDELREWLLNMKVS